MYAAIVFLPIIGSAIAGLFGRLIGARAAELITTVFLFISAALSVFAFSTVALGGGATQIVDLGLDSGWCVVRGGWLRFGR